MGSNLIWVIKVTNDDFCIVYRVVQNSGLQTGLLATPKG